MGGGGAIRTAAKVGAGAGWGMVSGGIRHGGSAPSFNPANASRPVSGLMNSTTSPDAAASEAVQMASWEEDGWEFAGGEEEVLSKPSEALPRMVFGATPTMEEAKEATSELKDALDKVYLSSPNSSGWIPSMVARVPSLSPLSNSEHSETKACVTSQTTIAASAPNHALQAFKLLSENTAAQTVVASIACDQNVWNAVLGNPAVVEFIESQKSSVRIEEETDKESVGDSDSQDEDSRSKFENIPDFSLAGRAGTGIADVLQSIKLSVLKMVSSVSDILHNIFGPPMPDHKYADGDAKLTPRDFAVGGSLMGLAVMVIMVVVMKRA